MLSVIFSVFLISLSIVGLVEIFHIISLAAFKTKKNYNIFLVVPMKGHNEEAELTLRNAISKVKWFSFNKTKKIICLDLGMDEETRQICNIFCYEYNFIKIYTIEEFENNLLNP